MPHHTTMVINPTTLATTCNETLISHFQYQSPSHFDIFTGILMILIIVTSLAGNILIVYAFATNAKLRVVNNYFIMNLTLSDILTASLVIPFDADMKLNGLSSWTHGAVMCKIWTTAYTISVPTSILTLCIVSIDRYQAISNPLGYRAGVTLNKTKALYLIGTIWALSLLMAFLPFIVGPPLNVTLSRDLPPDCPDVYFCYFDMSPSYSAVVTIVAFILPSIVMATLYLRMYVIITYERYICDANQSCLTEMKKLGGHTTMSKRVYEQEDANKRKTCGITIQLNGNTIDHLRITADKPKGNKEGKSVAQTNAGHGDQIKKVQVESQRIKNEHSFQRTNSNRSEQRTGENEQKIYEDNNGNEKDLRSNYNIYEEIFDEVENRSVNGDCLARASITAGNEGRNKINNKSNNEIGINRCQQENDRKHCQVFTSNANLKTRCNTSLYQTKVARHFSVIVLVQLICWYPFSVAMLVYNLCDGCKQISSSAQYFLLTIGYMSCAINPYLYAYQQRSFRQVFNRMLSRSS